MKKLIKSALALGLVAMTFSSCEDVPAPFDYNYTDPSTEETIAPDGDGTEISPYNVARTLEIINAGTYTSDKVYVKGIVTKIDNIDTSYGNATYFLGDTKTSKNTLEVYRGKYYNGDKFTTGNEIAVGDTIVLLGVMKNFGGTLEIDTGSEIISINGKKSDSGTGGETSGETGGEGTTGTQMTSDLIIKGNTGSVTLDTNKYGSQDTGNESTWYTWKFNNITYKGAKLCVSDGTYGEGIQVQGNATDNTKQGFIINADAFGSDIKTITLVLSVATTSNYDPGFNLYAGSTAHPMINAINATPTVTTGEKYKEYTYTFDLSSGSYRYFTIANDKVGAIYVKSVLITLK